MVLSGQAISARSSRRRGKRKRRVRASILNGLIMKLEFTKAGALKHWSAGAGDTSLGRRAGDATGELKLQDGRVIGKASQPNETEGMFPTGFDVHFDVALLRAGESLPARPKSRAPLPTSSRR